jgi:hypothetical protein
MATVSRNAKTGLILASIAAAWFIGVIVLYWATGG